MICKPATPEAYQLLHQGAIAFSEMEAAGLRIDVGHLDRTIKETRSRMADIERDLREREEFKIQRKLFGERVNVTSMDQLARVVFDEMGREPLAWTSGGTTGKKKPKMDEEVLGQIDSEYCRTLLRLKKLDKLHGTYLLGVRREVEDDGLLHPVYSLHTARSYRPSGSDPNFLNIPKRNKETAKLIRTAFVPREGHVLVDLDYSAQEVRVACNVTGDERLAYDTVQGDMHRDMAAECYMLPPEEMTKPIRQVAKAGFVFAEFYGSTWRNCARRLWDNRHLKTAFGETLADRLEYLGFCECGCGGKRPEPGTFEEHVAQVEDRFWNERFNGYRDWKRANWKRYEERGWFELITGFVCPGVYSRNQVNNYPIQGPAFHCLLWALIRMIREIKRRKMRAKIVGQIYDSILADVPTEEVDDYVELAVRITTQEIAKAWTWIEVPLAIDVDVSESNWFEKVPYEKAAEPVCKACGGTGKSSRGGVCVPCKRAGMI